MKTTLRLVILLSCLAATSHAWDVAGHMIVEKVAYDRTSKNARKKIDELSAKLSFEKRPLNCISIAAWADLVKHAGAGEPFNRRFGNWHFIDLGLSPSDPDLIKNPPPLTEKDGTVVEALKLCENAIRTRAYNNLVPSEEVALALICHLIGDLHQPMHCASHYTGQRHDGGGNSVGVANFKDQYPELHQFWDVAYKNHYDPKTGIVQAGKDIDALSVTDQSPDLLAAAAEIVVHLPGQPAVLAGDYYTAWALETHKVGVEDAYGRLNGSYEHPPITVSEQYTKDARTVGQQQIALAATRLAAVLRSLYPDTDK